MFAQGGRHERSRQAQYNQSHHPVVPGIHTPAYLPSRRYLHRVESPPATQTRQKAVAFEFECG